MYLTPEQVQKQYGFHPKTLADWADAGKIKSFRTPGGHRRYYASDFTPESGKTADVIRLTVLYARVSTHSQKTDLLTQADYLQANHAGEIIREIGSGMSFKRKKFIKLMEQVGRGEVGEIVIVHKDRLCRFGFDFVEWYCGQHQCTIKVLGKTELSPHAELMQDFMSIMHCFSSRLYFLRRYKDQIATEPTEKENSVEPLDISECNGVEL